MTETPKRFADAAAWSKWLSTRHDTPDGLWLLLAKKGTKGLSYVDALEVALSWGWIDGHKRPVNDTHWTQRFTPRRKTSAWSKINCGKAEALIAAGKMHASRARRGHPREGRWTLGWRLRWCSQCDRAARSSARALRETEGRRILRDPRQREPLRDSLPRADR